MSTPLRLKSVACLCLALAMVLGPVSSAQAYYELKVYGDMDGIMQGMTYYNPVTINCYPTDPSTVFDYLTVDGYELSNGSALWWPGEHEAVAHFYSFSVGSFSITRRFTMASPPAPGLAPVYRFYHTAVGTHFYTPSEQERDQVIRKWSSTFWYENVAYWTNPAVNPQPLYRFYNVRNASHFYTASVDERDSVIARYSNVYQFEGETYPVTPYEVYGSVPVYRFYNRRLGCHFYTASAEERDLVAAQWGGTYAYEGVAYWLAQ